jgi:predicted component of type VI protein secretion system
MRRRALAAVATVTALAGCSTTQQEAARLQLNAARIRASERRTEVTVPGRAVDVTRVVRVVTGDRTAFVVQVRNAGRAPVSDLPISVGVRVGSKRRIYVNQQSAAELSYFAAHLPLVAAGATLTWVYTTRRRLPAHARPFALVGGTPSNSAPRTTPIPVIRVSAVATIAPAATAGASPLAVSLHNLSSVPQYQLQVYAVAQRGSRFVAAGSLTVPHLGSNASSTVKVPILGHVDHARLQIEAPPTIFQ